jgi:hypothetical protein
MEKGLDGESSERARASLVTVSRPACDQPVAGRWSRAYAAYLLPLIDAHSASGPALA